MGRIPVRALTGAEADTTTRRRTKAETGSRLQCVHEPPDAEPHVRWCGRTAGVTPPPTRSLSKSDQLYFQRGTARQVGNFHSGAGRRGLGKKVGIDFVHDGKIVHVFQKNGGFNHMIK